MNIVFFTWLHGIESSHRNLAESSGNQRCLPIWALFEHFPLSVRLGTERIRLDTRIFLLLPVWALILKIFPFCTSSRRLRVPAYTPTSESLPKRRKICRSYYVQQNYIIKWLSDVKDQVIQDYEILTFRPHT